MVYGRLVSRRSNAKDICICLHLPLAEVLLPYCTFARTWRVGRASRQRQRLRPLNAYGRESDDRTEPVRRDAKHQNDEPTGDLRTGGGLLVARPCRHVVHNNIAHSGRGAAES